MPKIKKKRVGFKLDMTPMVDVAMLLLTFFMMTTQFRPEEATAIDLPSSHAPFKMPETDIMTVTVNKEGRVFLGVDSQTLRGQLFGEAVQHQRYGQDHGLAEAALRRAHGFRQGRPTGEAEARHLKPST